MILNYYCKITRKRGEYRTTRHNVQPTVENEFNEYCRETRVQSSTNIIQYWKGKKKINCLIL